ncbi:MAG: phosphate ABC transporter substrate-binding protein PstS [Synechococcales bacterium]|nr:phosphate ABC transporter substrate-binding protein PstS [Synechococcales bacterium]
MNFSLDFLRQAARPTVLRGAFPLAAALSLGLAACGPSTTTAPTPGGATNPGASPAAAGGGVNISGAGATAPNPLYQKWLSEFSKANPGTQIGYESVGSGAGIKQFLAEKVDFGATDSALKDDDRAKVPAARGKAIQVPSTGLFIVFAYNLDGVDNLKLSRESFCGIVDGSIKTWNDPQLTKDNAGVTLPNEPITFVHRSDGSGTTDIFTSHIAKACPNWKAGSGKSVEWPTGTGAKGNEGVTAQIQQNKGTLGYTEYSYAKENNLKMAAVQNKAGTFVAPSPEAAAKALEGVTMPEDFAVKVPDPEGKEAYPIVSLTWLLLYETYPDATKAETLKNFVKWAMKDGKAAATELGYIPLPDEVATKVVAAVEGVKAK